MASGGGNDNGANLAQMMRDVANGLESLNKSIKEVSAGTDSRIRHLENEMQKLISSVGPMLTAFQEKEVVSKLDLTAYRVNGLEKRVDGWGKWIGGIIASIVVLALQSLLSFLQSQSTGDK